MALESYSNALRSCPTTAMSLDYSKHVFKLIGLWFKNCHRAETQDLVNNLVEESICQIPTYHFVPLIYQIFSRIDNDDSSFQNTLQKFVLQISIDHPYHSIPQLIALSNGDIENKVEAVKR
jgi:ataxia telangiectasia mutated family protein